MSAISDWKTASALSMSCQELPASAGMPPAASVSLASGSLSTPIVSQSTCERDFRSPSQRW
jgi:hypothetical protein